MRRPVGQDGPVRERPAAIKRLDALFSASMIAHEAIFEICRELIAEGRGSAEQARQLEESARITTSELPTLATVARELAARWMEQSLLDPEVAKVTLGKFEAELVRVEPEAQMLLSRQHQIAVQLRAMLGD
jgi:hypothetical protein